MDKNLQTHYYFYSNEEGDGYEVYFCEYPHIKGCGDTYEEAYEDALEHLMTMIEKQKDDHE